MTRYKTHDGMRFQRVGSKNLWLQCDLEADADIQWIMSYDTVIGYLDHRFNRLVTSYYHYSPTTSKHITTLCNRFGYERLDIDEL